jgi:hypothetical protein
VTPKVINGRKATNHRYPQEVKVTHNTTPLAVVVVVDAVEISMENHFLHIG